MTKKLVLVAAASGLMLSAAVAQVNNQPGNAPPPGASQTAPAGQAATPATPAPQATMPASTAGGAQFIAAQSGDQWVASKFKGTDVLGPDDKKVGDVVDILFEKDGKVVAFVIGVGGFLGLGQKDVALAPNAFQVVSSRSGSTATTGTGGTTSSSTTTASTDPNDIKLKISMTKDQLKDAPAFAYYKAPSTAPTTGTAPRTDRPAAPAPAAPAPAAPATRPSGSSQ
jgi:PRC-barrel domain